MSVTERSVTERIMLEKLMPTLGCDPEFFFTNKGKILEASSVLPKEGFKYETYTKSKFVIDGVQAELNPNSNTCIANLANEIRRAFERLKLDVLDKQKVDLSFEGVIKFSEDDMLHLNEESKKFGCAPSKNLYTRRDSIITVNPATYQYRSAGGHIHIGSNYPTDELVIFLHAKPRLAVRLLDLVCGNTCVLVDRDPSQVERRKVYGRAGEYRLPKHGLEYRTLSNFWLHSYQMMSLAFGLARTAITIGFDIYKYEKLYPDKRSRFRKILTLVNRKDVANAINNNDFDLAKKNFDKIKKYLVSIENDDYHYPISKDSLDAFEYFVKKGMKYWFKEDPLTHWLNIPEGHNTGWGAFCTKVVAPEMKLTNEINLKKLSK